MTENGQEGILEGDCKNKIWRIKQTAINLKLSGIIFMIYNWEKREVLVDKEICLVKSKYYEQNKPKNMIGSEYGVKFWLKYYENPDAKDFKDKDCRRMVLNNKTFDFLYRERLSLILRAKEWATMRLLVDGKKVYEFNLEGRDLTSSSIWELNPEPNSFIQGGWVEDIISAFNTISNEMKKEEQRLMGLNDSLIKKDFGL